MTARELLVELDLRGIELYLDGSRLKYRAPAGALRSDDREAIAEHRPEIINKLQLTMQSDEVTREKCTHCDPRGWIDAPAQNGRIRTTCGKCSRFIGYRPAELGRR